MRADKGFEALIISDKLVNYYQLIEIIPRFTKKGRRCVLFGDNVSYYITKYVLKVYEKHQTKQIRSFPWETDFNCLEGCFLALKRGIGR